MEEGLVHSPPHVDHLTKSEGCAMFHAQMDTQGMVLIANKIVQWIQVGLIKDCIADWSNTEEEEAMLGRELMALALTECSADVSRITD